MTKLSLHTRIHYLKCKSFGLGFLYSITRNRLFFDKKIRTRIVLIALMNLLAACGNRGSELKTNSEQDTLSNKSIKENKLSDLPPSSYSDNLDTQITCYIPATNTSTGEPYTIVEEMPKFPNGNISEFIKKHLIYPGNAKAKGIQGCVITQFIVEKDGSITDAQVVRSVSPELNQEAIRIIKSMPRWIPGKQRNKVCRVKYTLPVNFKLPNEEKK